MFPTLRDPAIDRAPQVTDLAPLTTISATKPRLAHLHLWLSRAILGGIALQVFFAGLGLFSRLGFVAHAVFAPALFVATLALPIIGHLASLQRSIVARSWELVGLIIVQGLLIDLGRWVWLPISSLHPLHALALAFVAYTLARRRDANRL
jgi:Family of unknown function (DUF6220)